MTTASSAITTGTRSRSSANPRFWQITFTRTLIYVILIAIVVVEAFPLAWMIITSLKDTHEIFNTVLPSVLKWDNFSRVWVTMNFPVHLANSLYVTCLTVGRRHALPARQFGEASDYARLD